MTRERLVELIDLVGECEHWGCDHRVDITIDNTGRHRMNVYPYVGEQGSDSYVYFCSEEDRGHTPKCFIYDPNFDKAEAHVRKLLEEIEVEEC